MTRQKRSSVAQMSRSPVRRSAQRVARRGGQELGPHLADDHDGEHVHRGGEQARNDPGDEQLADVLLGDDAVDRQHGRRRQHGAERAAGGDHAGGERLRVVVAAHFRIGDGGERRRGGDRRARDRRKTRARHDGGNAKPALEMSDERIGGAKQLAAHARVGHERAHQQKHRDDAERVVGHRAHRGEADVLQRRRAADDVGKAADPDETHGHAHRHAQQHQREQGHKAKDRDRVGTQMHFTRPA